MRKTELFMWKPFAVFQYCLESGSAGDLSTPSAAHFAWAAAGDSQAAGVDCASIQLLAFPPAQVVEALELRLDVLPLEEG